MKFMVVWSIKPEHYSEALARFKESNPQPKKGIKLLGRWHEMGTGDGFSLFDVDDPIVLTQFLMSWADLVDQKIVPVVEEEDIVKAL